MFHDLTLKSVVSYIETHINEALDSKVLAKVAGYDEDYFRRIFKNGTGQSIAQYVRYRRLSGAAFALRNTGRSVTDIALDYGFASHDAFTRAFRTMTGQTPTAFRQSDTVVRGVVIVPGMMAPVIVQKENDETMTTQDTSGGGIVLYGVPKVSYYNDPPELTPFISSLRACLTYAGQSISYARLLAGSGAAFRLMWNREMWDGGNVDILASRHDPMEPIHLAFAAAGRTGVFLEKKDGNQSEMAALIRQEINAGRPVIGFGIIGPPEACVITGYRDNGDALLGWNFFQDFTEWKGSRDTDPCGYFIRRGWYEHSETIGVMAVGDAGPLPDERSFLKNTLRLAVEMMEAHDVNQYAGGQSAFDEWERSLLDETQFPKDAPLPMLMERLMCQGDAFTMVSEGRAYAGSFLAEAAESFPEYGSDLREIAEVFHNEHQTAWKMQQYHADLCMGEPQAKALALRDNREAIARLIRTCKELDYRALELIKGLLEKMG